MKKLFLLFFVTLLCRNSDCQEHLPDISDYRDLLKSKTLVVLEPNLMSDFNLVIRDAMEKNWQITPFDFISYPDFKACAADSHTFFLMVTAGSFERERTTATYSFLSLLRGEKNTPVGDMRDLCSIPLSYLKVEDDGFSYKMEAFIRFIQSHVKLILQSPSLIGENSFRYYNRNKHDLKGKMLYLTREDLAPGIDTPSEIREIYPHPFKIVSRQKVAQAIAEKKRDVVFLHKVGPEKTAVKVRVYKILIGAADPVFYYFDTDMVKKPADDAFQVKDLRQIR